MSRLKCARPSPSITRLSWVMATLRRPEPSYVQTQRIPHEVGRRQVMKNAIQTGIRPHIRGPCHTNGDPDATQSVLRARHTGAVHIALVAMLTALVAAPLRADDGTTLAALEIAYGR